MGEERSSKLNALRSALAANAIKSALERDAPPGPAPAGPAGEAARRMVGREAFRSGPVGALLTVAAAFLAGVVTGALLRGGPTGRGRTVR